ncbi:MAG: hypothetical protein JRJ00_00195 [Deltaproteobacteria bacterium]|nr:hypothetical protein [Deltaproteobacteria bacterium]
MMKKCTKCNLEKEDNLFYNRKTAKDGKNSICKQCMSKYSRSEKTKAKNNEYMKKYMKKYRLKESVKVKTQEYLALNRERIIEASRIYTKEHKEERKEYFREYAKEYNQINKKKNAGRRKARYANDKNFRITCLLRSSLATSIRGFKKVGRTIDILGCSIDEFINHLESQFTEGMTWENHGAMGWHIDHIMPCISFDLTKAEEQLKCFHFSNMRPLWAAANYAKGGKIPKELNRC